MFVKKNPRKVCGILLALCMAVMAAATVRMDTEAAEGGYRYKVRFFAGAQGTIDGQELVEYQDLEYGQRISFQQSRVALKDNSKYYIRGIRESGRDNDEILVAASFEVKEDKDYVVAYGLLGDAVMYTVEYVDAAGNALAPSETYYGNVGDRPVIAFAYIEGYQPQAYNLTGTLEADASRNVFRFQYTPIAQEQTPAPAPPAEGGTTQTPVPAPAPEGTETPEEETPVPEPETEIEDDPVPQTDPEEVVDIRDPEVPLSDGGPIVAPAQPNGFARLIGNLPLAAKILIGLAAAGAVVTAWFLLMHRRKKAAVKAEEAGSGKTREKKNSGE